jgi:hypothetical protein
MAIMVESPMAESIEYRPPTQSQNSNMFVGSMPNSTTFAVLVDRATKCLATARASPRPWSSQARALVALVMVSSVVNVLEATMKRVSDGSRSRVASTRSVASTFETKRKLHGARAPVAERLVRHDRAEVGASDPDVDDVPDGLAGMASPRARPDGLGETGHLVEHRVHPRHHVRPVHHDRGVPQRAQRPRAAPRGAR